MRKINIAVVDSNYKERRQTLSLVEEYRKVAMLRTETEWFNSGHGLLEEVEKNGSYDIYIIEPVLPDINGIRLVKELRKKSKTGRVIFLSETESYAYAAFEVEAFDYISKNANKQRLFKAIDKAIEDIIKNMVIPVIELELRSGYIRVPADNISHVDIVDRALCYHMVDGTLYSSKCLRAGFGAAVEKFLEQPWFILSGASHLINVSCIMVLHQTSAIMTNGETVPITHASYPLIRKLWKENRL